MGFTSKCNAKKSDKETQSPFLKIFKDFMMKDHADPEIRTLIKAPKKHERRKKTPSTKKSKTKARSTVPSPEPSDFSEDGSGFRKKSVDKFDNEQWKEQPKDQLKEQQKSSENEQEKAENTEDDNYSLSCALRKIVKSERACLLCIVLLICLSICLALFLVSKMVPCYKSKENPMLVSQENMEKPSETRDGDQTQRKIVIFKDREEKGFGDFGRGMENLLSLHSETDFEPNFRELNGAEDNDNPSNIAWTNHHPEYKKAHRNEKIEDFYKKLAQIDSKIKQLKKRCNTRESISQDRLKRSLLYNHPRTYFYRKEHNNKSKREKEPTGFVIEKKKVIVKYQKPKKVVPKCSHSPKDHFHTQEHLQIHPFYKNTQHLDEILNNLLDHNMPKDMKDPFNLDAIFKQNKPKCKHPNPHKIVNIKPKIDNIKTTVHKEVDSKTNAAVPNDKNGKTKVLEPVLTKNINAKNPMPSVDRLPEDIKSGSLQYISMFEKTTDGFDFELPTIPSTTPPDFKDTYKMSLIDKVPNLRKLQQVDYENDYRLRYDDLKDINDNSEVRGDTDNERKKRMQEKEDSSALLNYLKRKSLQNVNWKGPMPLYSDEVNMMMSQEMRSNPKINSEYRSKQDTDKTEEEISEMDYLQDYLNNKNDKLVEAAQAYSDYGVLDGKKESVKHEKNSATDIIITDQEAKFEIDNDAKELNRIRKEQHPNNYQTTQPTFKQNIISEDPDDEFALTDAMQKEIELGTTTETSPTKQNYFTSVKYCPKLIQGSKKGEIKSNQPVFSKNEASKGPFAVKRQASEDDIIDTTELSDILKKNQESSMQNISKFEFQSMNKEIPNQYQSVFDTITDKPVVFNLPKDINDINNEGIQKIPIDFQTEDKVTNGIKEMKDKIPRVKRFGKNTINVFLNNKKRENELDRHPNCCLRNITKKEFFQMINEWLNKLDTCKNKKNIGLIENYRVTEKTETTLSDNANDEQLIENIRHQSRSLLSLDLTINISVTNPSLTTDNIKHANNASIITTQQSKSKTSTTKKNDNNKAKAIDKDKSKVIAKRNADDSNLIFWNDIYDEEYGIQSDQPARDTSKQNDFIERSGRWVHDKIKRLKDNFKNTEDFDDVEKQRNPRSVFNDPHTNYNNEGSGSDNTYSLDRNVDYFADMEQKKLFTVLTKNMKEVCKKAARAVQTSNVAVRQDTAKNSEATTLMQQLVTLLAELVNYQVREQTCTTLPPDLQNFLQWLTDGQSQTAVNSQDITSLPNTPDSSTGDLGTKTSTPLNLLDLKTSVSNTLEEVEGLLAKYEVMNDDEKLRLYGVKAYLMKQLSFLKKKLLELNTQKVPKGNSRIRRYKRSQSKGRHNLKSNKYIKNADRKHTSKTETFYDTLQINDGKKLVLENNEKEINNEEDKSVEKRNLKDVYYKAVNDAKKMATEKSLAGTTKQIVK